MGGCFARSVLTYNYMQKELKTLEAATHFIDPKTGILCIDQQYVGHNVESVRFEEAIFG